MNLFRTASTIALAVGALSAPAEALVFSVNTNTSTSDSDTLTFARFNPGLGTLTGVTFTLTNNTANTSSSLSANFSGGEGGAAVGTVLTTFSIDVPGQLGVIFGLETTDLSCDSLPLGCTDGPRNGVPSFLPGGTTVTITSGLAAFIDSGGPTTFDVTARLEQAGFVTTCEQTFSGLGDCEVSSLANWSGEVTVEFLFEPPVTAPVPVPASMVLFGAGLAGLAALRRRSA